MAFERSSRSGDRGVARKGAGRVACLEAIQWRLLHMSEQVRILVTGAGGFIGHHLVTYLKKQGYWVRGVDVKYPEYGTTDADEFAQLDLRHWEHAQRVTEGIDEAYLLAADMGGMGFISIHHAQ